MAADAEILKTAPGLDLDTPLTKARFAAWSGLSLDWVKDNWSGLPGRFYPNPAQPTKQSELLHPRTYLAQAGKGRLVLGSESLHPTG